MKRIKTMMSLSISMLWLGACTTINVDHIKLEGNLTLNKGDSVVVLGRHHSAEFETEPSLVSCIGNRLASSTNVEVIQAKQFTDEFYPWFEARTAPLHPKKLQQIFDQPSVSGKVEALNIRYFIWVEGATKRTDSAGSMACALSPAGGGCFGFGVWEDTSDYEITIWDIDSMKEAGRISTDAVGTSYMPAFVIPLPMLAGVEKDACQGMTTQLTDFFVNDKSTLKRLP